MSAQIACLRHRYIGVEACPECAAQTCEHCKQAPSTEDWGGMYDSVSLARNPGLIQRWCRRCVLTAQVTHMRPLVAKLAEIERELAELEAGEKR